MPETTAFLEKFGQKHSVSVSRGLLVRGTLKTVSPLSIGSGLTHADRVASLGLRLKDLPLRPEDSNEENLSGCRLIVRDAKTRPYIPGSALKGAIRSGLQRLVSRGVVRPEVMAAIVGREPGGTSERNDDEPDMGLAAGVIFFDSFVGRETLDLIRCGRLLFPHLPWWDEQTLSYIEASAVIDRRTGTVADHLLRFTEAVPPGIKFDVELQVSEKLTGEQVGVLLRVLNEFNRPWRDGPLQSGSETRDGWGRMEWTASEVEAALPQSPFSTGNINFAPVNGDVLPESHDRLLKSVKNNATELKRDQPLPCPTTRCSVAVTLKLDFKGPFLVKNPAQRNDPALSDDKRVDMSPRLTAEGHAVLPASGFRGVFRSQVEKIIRTFLPEAAVSPSDRTRLKNSAVRDTTTSNEEAEQHFVSLFGEDRQASALWVEDFAASVKSDLQRLEMVAIDRFTGSVSGSAKYNVNCIDSPTLTGTIRLQLPHHDSGQAMLGLIVLALRDLIEGDLAFGFGTYRGFGACTASIEGIHVSGVAAMKDNSQSGKDQQATWQQLLKRSELPVTDTELNSSLDELIEDWKANGRPKAESTKVWDAFLDKCLEAVTCLLPATDSSD